MLFLSRAITYSRIRSAANFGLASLSSFFKTKASYDGIPNKLKMLSLPLYLLVRDLGVPKSLLCSDHVPLDGDLTLLLFLALWKKFLRGDLISSCWVSSILTALLNWDWLYLSWEKGGLAGSLAPSRSISGLEPEESGLLRMCPMQWVYEDNSPTTLVGSFFLKCFSRPTMCT